LLVEYDVLEIGLMAGAGDTTRPGRITLADTVEQRLLIEALAPTQQVFILKFTGVTPYFPVDPAV
jgi:hypothetical protein